MTTVSTQRLCRFSLLGTISTLQAFQASNSIGSSNAFVATPQARRKHNSLSLVSLDSDDDETFSPNGHCNGEPETTMNSVLRFIDKECQRLANPQIAKKMGVYVKNIHPFYGIKSPELRSMVQTIQSQHRKNWTAPLLLDTAERLLEDRYAEKKMVAAYLLGAPSNLKLLSSFSKSSVRTIGNLIESHVNDWATCDALSSQVVRKIIQDVEKSEKKKSTKNTAAVVAEVESWSKSSNDWKQRASCISFVVLARQGNQHNDTIFRITKRVLENPARFPQLGVGWVLREVSTTDEPAVVRFLQTHYHKISREGLRYAIEKMEPKLRQELLRYEPE